MSKIKVAFIGAGNCTSAILQGIQYYKNGKNLAGLMHPTLSGYKVKDIVPVAVFDVDEHKVGKDLSKAIFAEPNCALKFADVPQLGVKVMMGPVMDGVTKHLAKMVKVSKQKPVDVKKVLNKVKPDVVVNTLPTGSIEASKFYAAASIKAGAGFVNGMPALIVNDKKFVKMAEDNGVSLIGDDVKSQVGGTIFHRALLKLFMDRGVKIKHTYQLNVAGNSDFFNQLDRKETKVFTKMNSMKTLVPYEYPVWGGAAGYIEHLNDSKEAWTFLEGENFGGTPMTIISWFKVSDSPNFAGVMVDAIRCCKLATDRKISGVLTSASSYFTKCPPEKMDDVEAKKRLEEFIQGKRER